MDHTAIRLTPAERPPLLHLLCMPDTLADGLFERDDVPDSWDEDDVIAAACRLEAGTLVGVLALTVELDRAILREAWGCTTFYADLDSPARATPQQRAALVRVGRLLHDKLAAVLVDDLRIPTELR
jgi:hypothetical protein